MRLRPFLQTGTLTLLAVGLVLVSMRVWRSTVPVIQPGGAVQAAMVAIPSAPPVAPPTSVPVYDAAAVIAASTPPVETIRTATSKPELSEPPPAPPVRRRPETQRPPNTQPRDPAQPASIPTPAAASARPWESTSTVSSSAPTPAPVEPSFLIAPSPALSLATTPATVGGLRAGRYPSLSVDYQSIGLERYVRATEAAGGAFFAFLGSRGIGPQISLIEGRIVRTARAADLAIERPYLVSDAAIEHRLQGLDLPEGSSLSSVVMVWPRDLDRRAWRAIDEALRAEALSSDQVAQVDARFVEGAELQIIGFTLQADGARRRLSQPRKILVPAS